MTNAELIQAIKTEIERLKAKYRKDMYKSSYEGLASGYKIEAYNELLSFLDSLESEKPVPKDLEEASSKFATHAASNGVSIEFLEEKLSFQEGAKWDRRQIMKNAKDGWIDEECVIVLNDGTRIDLQPDYEKKPAFEFEYAQDVQVIILPREDSNDTRRKE